MAEIEFEERKGLMKKNDNQFCLIPIVVIFSPIVPKYLISSSWSDQNSENKQQKLMEINWIFLTSGGIFVHIGDIFLFSGAACSLV